MGVCVGYVLVKVRKMKNDGIVQPHVYNSAFEINITSRKKTNL